MRVLFAFVTAATVVRLAQWAGKPGYLIGLPIVNSPELVICQTRRFKPAGIPVRTYSTLGVKWSGGEVSEGARNG